ncbi:amidohydrolase [Alloiococcus sp. CFN-8]|uniref:amidohydrolase n=1 Tax=Alloiococcus sp. CFN-8 TaxID=3416081 RepID=UPI003CF7F51F
MLLIKDGNVFTMAGNKYSRGSILIDKGKIVKIEETIELDSNKDVEIIDAANCWVLPGLIEAHCHIGIKEERKGFEGDDCNEMSSPITPFLRALDGINPMDSAFYNALSSGITGVMVGPGSSNVVGGQWLFMKTDGRIIDDMVVLEPAAMKVAFGENVKSTYNNKNMMPMTRMAIAAMLREELFEAKKYKESKEASMKENKSFEEDFRKECWLPVLSGSIPLKAHAHRADDILTAIRIAKEFNLKLTIDHCTEGHLVAKEIFGSGYPAIVGPSLVSRNKIETQYADYKTPGLLHKEGIKIAITTDHPVTRIQDLTVCAAFAVKEGLDMEEALRSITINAAEICNVDHRVGSIEVGKDADIAIYDGNPLEIFTKTLFTIINGRIVYKADEMKD